MKILSVKTDNGITLNIGDKITVKYYPIIDDGEDKENPVTKEITVSGFEPTDDGSEIGIIDQDGEKFYDDNISSEPSSYHWSAKEIINEFIPECEAQCGTTFYKNILKAMEVFNKKELDAKIEKIETEIDQRIAQLIDADNEFCKDRWDMSKSELERGIYREMSNQVTATRQELQMLKKNLGMGENKLEADQSVRDIATETYKANMQAFAEGVGKPFSALAWHVYKRAFDIASYSLPKKTISQKEWYEKLEKKLLKIESDELKLADYIIEVRDKVNSTEFQVMEQNKPIPIDAKVHRTEYIICSAVRWNKTFICGRRHKDCYNIADALMNGGFLERERKHQGFMTSTGRFVDREEAFQIAKQCKQIVHKMFDDDATGSLTSEDLFGVEE